jgi:hypothetical protein
VPSEMFEFLHLGPAERGANAEWAHRAIGARLAIRFDCSQKSLHLDLRGCRAAAGVPADQSRDILVE